MRQFRLFYSKITDYGRAVVPGQIRYACRFWSSHLRHMGGPAMGLLLGGGTSISDLRKRLHLSSNGDSSCPLTLSLSSDRSQLSSTFCGQNYRWGMKTGDHCSVLTGHGDIICCVAFSPDGRQLVSGARDGSINLWDMQKHSLVRTFEGHTDQVWTVAFSPQRQSNLIASGSDDGTICLWDPASPRAIAVLRGHEGLLYSVTFSPDGRMIASGSSDKTVRRWDVRLKPVVQVGSPLYGHNDTVRSVVYTPDGQQIISGSDGTICVWDHLTGELLSTSQTVPVSGGIRTLSISPNGYRVIASGSTGVLEWTWNGKDLRRTKPPFHLGRPVYSLAFSPDGKSFAFDASDRFDLEFDVNFWDWQTGRSTRYVSRLVHQTHQVAFSPDGSKIAFGDRKVVRIWDTPLPESAATSRALLPAGTLILSHLVDGTVRLQDSRT